jgi:hypothetical protein
MNALVTHAARHNRVCEAQVRFDGALQELTMRTGFSQMASRAFLLSGEW